jgi:hypothetical protein
MIARSGWKGVIYGYHKEKLAARSSAHDRAADYQRRRSAFLPSRHIDLQAVFAALPPPVEPADP